MFHLKVNKINLARLNLKAKWFMQTISASYFWTECLFLLCLQLMDKNTHSPQSPLRDFIGGEKSDERSLKKENKERECNSGAFYLLNTIIVMLTSTNFKHLLCRN